METDLIERIRAQLPAGSLLRNASGETGFEIAIRGWGRRRGEPALLYAFSGHSDPLDDDDEEAPEESGVAESEFLRAFDAIGNLGELRRQWVNYFLPECAAESRHNFRMIGETLTRIGEARVDPRRPALYRSVRPGRASLPTEGEWGGGDKRPKSGE